MQNPRKATVVKAKGENPEMGMGLGQKKNVV